MDIHFQTTDHVVAVEKVAEQHIGTKLCSSNTFEDISHLLIHSYKSYNYIREKCYYSLKSRPKFTKHFSPWHRILLYYPVGQKFTRNRSISYGLRDICDFSLKVAIK